MTLSISKYSISMAYHPDLNPAIEGWWAWGHCGEGGYPKKVGSLFFALMLGQK